MTNNKKIVKPLAANTNAPITVDGDLQRPHLAGRRMARRMRRDQRAA